MSDLARQLIADNKRTKATFLDLGKCGLTEIPNEIQELRWLEGLAVADSWSEGNDDTRETKTHNSGPRNDQLREIGPLAALRHLKSFYAKGTSISDVSPLAALSDIQNLDISYTQVTDLTPLTRLPSLQTLDISCVPLADFPLLAKLPHLRALNLLGTEITDLKPLARLSHLQYLGLVGSPVKDLTPLAGLADLQRLRIDHTHVVDLTPLAKLLNLQALDLLGTRVMDLSPLASLSKLQNLNIAGTPVADATPLADLRNLQSCLNIAETHIADVAPLGNLLKLQSLNIADTPVTDVTPLGNLLNLHFLDIKKTPVSDITPLGRLLKLQTLGISETSVSDITSLGRLPNLQTIDLSDTSVTDIAPLERLLNLQTVDISRTHVTDMRPLRRLISQGSIVRAEHLLPVSALGILALLGPAIYIEGCHLTNPPLEIAEQGNDAILEYFRECEGRAVMERARPSPDAPPAGDFRPDMQVTPRSGPVPPAPRPFMTKPTVADGPTFDVFLSHNSRDKPVVHHLKVLLEKYELSVWFDEDELQPGLPWQPLLERGIRSSRSVVVVVGNDGAGPWENEEMQAVLQLAVREGRPVIPVLLPGSTTAPELPLFLANRTWVDLRDGWTDDGLAKLVWGITGTKPRPVQMNEAGGPERSGGSSSL